MKVLVVEDNIVTLDALCLIFTLAGHEAQGAANGYAALSRLELYQPDLLVCDLYMPGMGGIELARHLRGQPQWAALSIIIQTAIDLATDPALRAALSALGESGPVAVLTKPYEPSRLLALAAQLAGGLTGQ